MKIELSKTEIEIIAHALEIYVDDTFVLMARMGRESEDFQSISDAYDRFDTLLLACALSEKAQKSPEIVSSDSGLLRFNF